MTITFSQLAFAGLAGALELFQTQHQYCGNFFWKTVHTFDDEKPLLHLLLTLQFILFDFF